MPFDGFTDVMEAQITRAISNSWMEELRERTDTEVVVVGGGPLGLVAVKELAECGVDVTVVEKNNYLDGGFWLGGFLMNEMIVRDPTQRVLDELGVPYEGSDEAEGLYIVDGPHTCSALIKVAYDADVKIQNMAEFTGVVLRENDRVGGTVISWMPIHTLPRELICVDPATVESDLVLDMTGHDTVVLSKFSERDAPDVGGIEHVREHNTGISKAADGKYGASGHDSPGHGSAWVSENKGSIVDVTGIIHPSVVASGMAVAMTRRLPCMGSMFGAMLLSGRWVVQSCLDELGYGVPDMSIPGPASADD